MEEEMPVISGERFTILGNLLTAMLGAGLLGLLVYLSGVRLYAEPFSEEIGGIGAAAANAVLFVVLATMGATLVVILLKYGRERLLHYLLISAFAFIGIVIVIFFGYTFLIVFTETDQLLALFILSALAATAALAFIMVEDEARIKNAALLIFGSGVGAFLGVILPIWTSLLLLIGLALYDYISVKKGPIRKIVELTEEDPDKLGSLAVSSAEWDIGLGDITFYCMMTVLSLVNFGLTPTILTVAGIIAGFFVTLRLLEKRGIMPGLPIPVGLGLLGLLLGVLLRLVLPIP